MIHTTSDVLVLAGISRRYGTMTTPVHALQDVTLGCRAGTWTAIMARQGRASRPCSTVPPGSTDRPLGACCWQDATCRP